MKTRKSGLQTAWEDSAILSFLRRIASAFYAFLLNGVFGKLRNVYPAAVNASQSNLLRRQRKPNVKNALARKFSHGFFITAFSRFSHHLLDTTCQSYGMIGVTYGIASSFYYLLQLFADSVPLRFVPLTFFCSLTIALFSLILLFFNLPLGQAVSKSRLFSFFCFDVLGIAKNDPAIRGRGIPLFRSFFYGTLLCFLTVLFPPGWVFLVIFILILILLIMQTPEFSLSLSLICVPIAGLFFNGGVLLAAILILGALSYLAKLLLGKRTISAEPMDFIVFFGMIIYLFAGIFSFGGIDSLKSGCLSALMLLGYFLAANLLNGRRSLLRFCRLSAFAGTVTSIYGIIEYATGNAVSNWLDTEMFPDIKGRIVSTFDNANILAVYLLLSIFLDLSLLLIARTAAEKTGALFSFGITAAALVLTWSRGAWIGFLFAGVAFLLLYSRRSPVLLLLGGVALPLCLYLLPSTILTRLLSGFSLLPGGTPDSSVTYRENIWQGVLRMLFPRYFAGGIGVGDSAFSALYPAYALSGAEEAVHAHNVYLQLWTEAGIAGLLFLILTALFLFLDVISHRSSEKKDFCRILHIGCFSSLFAVLLAGLGDHVFYSPRVLCLFFMTVGFSVALSRLGREREKEFAMSVGDDSNAFSVDVPIRNRR